MKSSQDAGTVRPLNRGMQSFEYWMCSGMTPAPFVVPGPGGHGRDGIQSKNGDY